jgi:Ca-activated chloride channel family protein
MKPADTMKSAADSPAFQPLYRQIKALLLTGFVVFGAIVLLWWLFFSRAPWLERLGAIVIMVVAVAVTKFFIDPSIAGAGMGKMFPILSILPMSLALVAAVVVGRNLSTPVRRGLMVVAILIGCGSFTLIRTGGISGGQGAIIALFDKLPKPTFDEQVEGTKKFFRELNRLALTGVYDPGGNNLAPDDYQAVFKVWRRGEMTVRVAYTLCGQTPGSESYNNIVENDWFNTSDKPLSTFSVDVDEASYSNVRRFLTEGALPPPDAVRIEELVNYFDYDYPDPRGEHPFSITTEVADCPWNRGHKLVHIGLQGRHMNIEQLPPANLVFLIDVSGSMNEPDKLPLLKSSFRLLVDQLRDEDRVAIVVYAGAAGLVLPSTPGSHKEEIRCAIDRLEAGGSTAGAAGIQLAYQVAQQCFMKEGNNRVILATDGDFNVGVSSDGELTRIIEERRRTGIFLTVLGFGEGNLKDSRMEMLADKGNGNYAYIDNLVEGKKVFVNEIGATLLTIAKDVKLQVEFNPARVASYRLVGYENRVLQDRDFDDDSKDAGEIGAGHAVTALYEIALTDEDRDHGKARKYSSVVVHDDARRSSELLTVSFRYKRPDEDQSRLLAVAVKDRGTRFADASDNFRFSAAVAEFGMLLRGSEQAGTSSMDDVIRTARSSRGEDDHGYRAEFVNLAETARTLMSSAESAAR